MVGNGCLVRSRISVFVGETTSGNLLTILTKNVLNDSAISCWFIIRLNFHGFIVYLDTISLLGCYQSNPK